MHTQDILQDCKHVVADFRKQHPDGVVVIRGATATGKSRLSIQLSDFFDSEIISSDSRQIFKHMDIGTDKIPLVTREKVPHHIIDFLDPQNYYTAGQRKNDAEKAIQEIQRNGKLPMIVGGTGLYVDTIYKNFSMPESAPNTEFREEMFKKEESDPGYLYRELTKIDPVEAAKIHPKSTRYLVRALEIFHTTGKPKSEIMVSHPVKWPLLMIGLRRSKEKTNELIDTRIENMIDEGLIQEVEKLLALGYSPSLQSMQGIGYKQTVEYLEGKYDKEQLIKEIQDATHHLAKKQRTRFRRYISDQTNNPKNNVTYKVYELE